MYSNEIDSVSKTWSGTKCSVRIYGANITGSTTIPLENNAKGGKYFVLAPSLSFYPDSILILS